MIALFVIILLTNILNIPNIKHLIYKEQEEKFKICRKLEEDQKNKKDVKEEKYNCKIYSVFSQIGILYAYENESEKMILDFVNYLCAVLILMTFYFIHIELKSGLNIKTEEEVAKLKKMREMDIIKTTNGNNDNSIEKNNKNFLDNSKIQNNKIGLKGNNKDDKEKDKKTKKSTLIFEIHINFFNINIIYRFINYLISHPNFNYEIERIISILWTYYYRNYYSLGMYLVLFCSFFFVDIAKNKFLVLFILTPILLITIGSFHISNIAGIIENLEKEDAEFYAKFAIKKYDNHPLEHIIGHVYFLTVIFLIYTFYSKKKSEKKGDKDLKIKNNELLEDIIPKNEEKPNQEKNGILEDDLYENKSDDEYDDSESSNEDSENSEEGDLLEEAKKIKLAKPKRISVRSFKFQKLLIKKFFLHIDKITLIVLYIVCVYAINATHVLLALIFVLQIIIPKQIKYLYRVLIIVFQIVYLIEFIIDLLKKSNYKNSFNKYPLDMFIVYTEEEKCDIELLLYAVIYCFYFQNTTCKLKYIKRILEDDAISYGNYINNKLEKYPTLYRIINFINSAILHLIFWLNSLFSFLGNFLFDVLDS